jgi:hypothetical protein
MGTGYVRDDSAMNHEQAEVIIRQLRAINITLSVMAGAVITALIIINYKL